MKIGIITSDCDTLKQYFPTKWEPDFVPKEPPFTPDDEIAVRCLREKGIKVEPVIWGTLCGDVKNFDALIIRSPWDYMETNESKTKFFKWLKELGEEKIKVLNDINIVSWLYDKHYLMDFEKCGVDIVPTHYIESPQDTDFEQRFNKEGAFVIKPAIGGAGKGVKLVQNLNEAKNLKSQLTNSCYLVQNFIEEIKTFGEWSLIFFGSKYSHAIHKMPAKDSFFVHAERGGTLDFSEPEQEMIDFAQNAVSKISQAFRFGTGETYKNNLLYLRIDILKSKNGYMVSEVEGVEPELFFRAKKGSEEIFAQRLIEIMSM